MNFILLVLIAFKVACLFFCWKGMAMARKGSQKNNKNPKMEQSNYLSEEWKEAQNRMSQLMKQNQELSNAIQEMKGIDSTSFKLKEKENL